VFAEVQCGAACGQKILDQPNMKQGNIDAIKLLAPGMVALLKILANEDRLLMVKLLADEECDVEEIGAALQIRQPTLSQQLGVLRRAKLLTARRNGKHVYYRMANREVLQLIAMIDTL
jgi:ArsR family transcriptional regulator